MDQLQRKVLSLKNKTRRTEEGFQIPVARSLAQWRMDNLRKMRRETPRSKYDYDFYLSGGMTGIKGHNFNNFNCVTHNLRQAGFRVFNPAENFGGAKDRDLSTYMRKDHRAVTRCGSIMLLPSFVQSKGALAELRTALSIPDMGVYTINKLPDSESILNTLIINHR